MLFLHASSIRPAVLTITLSGLFALNFFSCNRDHSTTKSGADALPTANAYIGPEACSACHAGEYQEWKKSDHFKAMMVAGDSSVSGDFNNAELRADGITSRFFKRDGKFFINTEGDDGNYHDYEVKYTFGYYPLQQYLVEFPGGRMQVPRQSYDVIKKQWYHQYNGQKIHPHDWLHWTKQSQNWNSMCAACHSTNLQRNYDEATDSYHTTWSHLNVSCESCHGMGKNHVDYIGTTAYREGTKVKGSYLALYKGQKNTEQLSACVQCHSRRMEVSAVPFASTEALDNFIPIPPTTENYFADGQFRDEDYEYGSFTQSKMYHRGVSCSNCHNPHSGKILLAGNPLCLKCHQPKYDLPEHTFHIIGSEGSKCVNCHMPTRTYMGADVRRDHSFRIPRPDQSVKYNTPNACTNCHAGKKAQWAAEAIVKWYGGERKHHYSDELIPGSMLDENSFSHLDNLLEDTAVTDMIRATAINYMGEMVSEKSLNAIKKFLYDTSAVVRNQAVTSLANFPPQQWIRDAEPLLQDPVRGVRIAAANTLSGLPEDAFDTNKYPAFASANKELLDFLHNQSDFSTGNVSLGDYYYKTGNKKEAEKYYLRALKIDSVANYARLNLSSIYNAEGQNDKAMACLNEAWKIDPANPRISYNLALLHVELGNKKEALNYFDRTSRLKYNYDKFYFNYALFLQQQGQNHQAEALYQEGLQRFPDSEQLNYGAAYFFLQVSQKERALACIRKLKMLNPSNPDYAEMFRLIQ